MTQMQNRIFLFRLVEKDMSPLGIVNWEMESSGRKVKGKTFFQLSNQFSRLFSNVRMILKMTETKILKIRQKKEEEEKWKTDRMW